MSLLGVGGYQNHYQTQSICGTIIAEEELQPIRFQGQFLDTETGLHYNRFRYYDSDVGMFIQRDPIGLLGGNNVFAYAPNPIHWIDVFGLANRPNNGKYHSFFNFQLDPSNYYSSDSVQFNRANKAFIEKLNSSKAFKKDMLKRYPELNSWIRSGNKSGSPIFGKDNDKYGLTWHHNDKTGLLELVDFQDHRSNFSLYHPDGKGGREKWGGGKAGRRGRLDGLTGKPKNKNCTI